MAIFTRRSKENPYDALIKSVILRLDVAEEGTDEYKELLSNLERLERLNKEVHEPLLDADKTVAALVNLVGIFVILKHEQLNVITSKAFSIAMKLK